MKLKGEVFDHTLRIKNDGDQALRISRVQPKCPCARITDFDKSIEPGEFGEIKMTIDSGRIAVGRFEKKITIFTNVFPTQQIYWFQIEVRPAFVLKPLNPVIAGLFGEAKTSTILISKVSENFEIVEAKSKNGFFKVDGIETVYKGMQYRLRLTAPPAQRPEKKTDELVLQLRTNSGREIKTEMGTTVDHQSAIVMVPNDRVFWSNKETNVLLAEGATPISKPVVVRAVDPKVKFNVKSAAVGGKNTEIFDAKIETQAEGRAYVVHLAIREYSRRTYVKGKLVIEVDDGSKLELEVMAMFGRRRK